VEAYSRVRRAVELQSILAFMQIFAAFLSSTLLAAQAVHAQAGQKVEDRLGFTVRLDLFVGQSTLVIERRLACEMRMRMHPGPNDAPGDPGLGRRAIWEPNARNFRHELNDGSVLVVFTPPVCDLHAKRLKELPPFYVPAMALLEKKAQFETIEFYVTPRYFERADAKFRFISVHVKPAPALHITAPDAELDRLLEGRMYGERTYVGLVAYTYTEDVWRDRASLAQFVQTLADFTKITDPDLRKQIGSLRRPIFLQASPQTGINLGPDSRRHNVSALAPANGHWRLNVEDYGVVRMHYRPSLNAKSGANRREFLESMRQAVISVGGHPTAETLPASYYDPATREIHFISLEYLIW
jgi:hypothetical protein